MASGGSVGRAERVVIVGAGIAGIAAALRLAEAGVRVTLLETRKKLGGRATSFDDIRSGLTLDNCQHVVLGCCANYLDLLERMGVREHITWTREQYWIEVGGRVSVVKPSVLPAPAHFSVSIVQAPMFSMAERVALARAASKILRADRAAHAHRTFLEFLRDARQPETLIRRFWSPVVVSACNLDVDRVSAAAALHVFQEGFFATRSAADVGVSSVALVRLYDHVESKITGAGGRVILGAGVESIDSRGALATSGERFEGDALICAVPVERVVRLLSPEIIHRDTRFALLDKFTHSPILGVHMQFDQPIMGELPHCVLVDRPTQWLFRKNAEGTQVHAVISAADAWVSLPEAEIGERVLSDIRACLASFQPRSRTDQPKLLSVRSVKEKLATFAPVPGVDALRPGPCGPSGIVLAGDYTRTGWPATMEGATRSGYMAAARVLGMPESELLVPPVRPCWLARMLGLRGRSSNDG